MGKAYGDANDGQPIKPARRIFVVPRRAVTNPNSIAGIPLVSTAAAIQLRSVTNIITHGGKPSRYTAQALMRHFLALVVCEPRRAYSEQDKKSY